MLTKEELEAEANLQEIRKHVRALRREGVTLREISDELASRGVFTRNDSLFGKHQTA